MKQRIYIPSLPLCSFPYSPRPEDWHVSKVTSMRNLFHGFSNFSLDIRQWEISGVKDFVSNIIIVLCNTKSLLVFSYNCNLYCFFKSMSL